MKISLSTDGKIKFTTGPDTTRLDDLKKWLGRNPDALLVKLDGPHEVFDKLKPGHLCRIEIDDDGQHYNAFVGKHFLGQLPEEAIAFAKSVEYSPEFLIAIVGKIEYGASSDFDEIYIYIAE